MHTFDISGFLLLARQRSKRTLILMPSLFYFSQIANGCLIYGEHGITLFSGEATAFLSKPRAMTFQAFRLDIHIHIEDAS